MYFFFFFKTRTRHTTKACEGSAGVSSPDLRLTRRKRRPAFVQSQLAHQTVLRELGEGHRDDRNGQHRGTESVQRSERAFQLDPVVHPWNEDDLSVQRDPPLGEPAELWDDVGRFGVAE